MNIQDFPRRYLKLNIQEYVAAFTERGECRCGRCLDVGNRPDPVGHTVDLVFFPVSKRGEPSLEEFTRLTAEHKGAYGDCDPFDGGDHNYIELGGWIGDQSLAMRYMGLGVLLGAFHLLSPKTMLKLDGDLALQLAMAGLLSIQRQKAAAVSA